MFGKRQHWVQLSTTSWKRWPSYVLPRLTALTWGSVVRRKMRDVKSVRLIKCPRWWVQADSKVASLEGRILFHWWSSRHSRGRQRWHSGRSQKQNAIFLMHHCTKICRWLLGRFMWWQILLWTTDCPKRDLVINGNLLFFHLQKNVYFSASESQVFR